MTSRKAALKDDENPCKRRRVANDSHTNFLASLDGLNNDCVLCIASFLPIDDLNTFGTISRRYRQIRRHESLDQTRIAIIICSRRNRSTPQSLCTALDAAGGVLSAHYTHLRILGLNVLEGDPVDDRILIHLLPNVTKLELASNPNESRENARIISEPILSVIPTFLPNIEKLVFSGVMISDTNPRNRCFWGLSHLTTVKYVGEGRSLINMTGWDFSESSSLTELTLDNCCFILKLVTREENFAEMKRTLLRDYSHETPHEWERFVLFYCRHLQRLSMKGATCDAVYAFYPHPQPEPFPQEMLIKMVRHHPTLRWLRSDLSAENVAMLQQERPEITFVSE